MKRANRCADGRYPSLRQVIWNTILSTASSDLVFAGGGVERSLVVRRHPKSRGLRLRVDPRDGRVLMTMPKRASLKRALAWAEEQRPWIEGELAKVPEDRPIFAGGTVPYRGAEIPIDWEETRPRTVRWADGRLRLGGPEGALAGRVLRWLKAEAKRVLTDETHHYAAIAGVTVSKVAIGDARSRWGSCASSGAIRYNWRLVMAPPEVLSATVAHEVAHRVHMDHSPRFHALVAELFGREPKAERRWLREHGAGLYRVGV